MKLLFCMVALLLFETPSVYGVDNGKNDSSNEQGGYVKPITYDQVELKKPSWWQRATRWVVGGVAATTVAAKAYLPSFVKTGIGYTVKPITWTISKVTGWENMYDFLADDNSTVQWLFTTVLGEKMMGFSDKGTASKEVAKIARIIQMAKKTVIAREKGLKFEKREEYEKCCKALYNDLLDPEKTFTLRVVFSLVDTLLMKENWMSRQVKSRIPFLKNMSAEYLKFVFGTGLQHLSEKHLRAFPILLILALYNKMPAGAMSNDVFFDMIEQKAKFAREMANGMSFYTKVKQAFKVEFINKRRAEQLKARKMRTNMTVAPTLSDGKNAKAPPPPTLTEKMISSARKSINFWTMLFIAIILGTLCLISWRSGMIQPPTSKFADTIGTKKVDVYIPEDVRNVEEEMEVADMV